MNILITGGAGYIGSHACKALLDLEHKVYIIDNFSNSSKLNLNKKAKFLDISLNDLESLTQALKKHKIDAVMHFAAFKAVGESIKDPLKYYHNNVVCSLNLIKAMNLANVNYLIFSSSAAVYGQPKTSIVKEDAPLSPINPYGKSKKIIEIALKDVASVSNLKYIALRYFNVAGYDASLKVGMREKNAMNLIPIVINSIIDNQTINVFGNDYETKDGTPIRDYIHVTDLVDAHIKALIYLLKYNKSNVFNLGNSKGYSVTQILRTTEKVLSLKLKINNGPRREGDPAILVADSSKAKKILNWKPKLGLDEMIESTYKLFSK